MDKNEKPSGPLQKQRKVKIGKLYFKPEIKKLLKLYPQLRQNIIGTSLSNEMIDDISYRQQDTFLSPQTFLNLILQSSDGGCCSFPPSMILHIKFLNLQFLNFNNCSMHNIENLTFMKSNFVDLRVLLLWDNSFSMPTGEHNMLRSIQPLVKIQMPEVFRIDFNCGEMNCMGRLISRIKISKEMSHVRLETFHNKSIQSQSCLSDQDLSIWLKLEAEELGQLEKRMINEDMPSDVNRIQQPKVEACLRRKYGNKVVKGKGE